MHAARIRMYMRCTSCLRHESWPFYLPRQIPRDPEPQGSREAGCTGLVLGQRSGGGLRSSSGRGELRMEVTIDAYLALWWESHLGVRAVVRCRTDVTVWTCIVSICGHVGHDIKGLYRGGSVGAYETGYKKTIFSNAMRRLVELHSLSSLDVGEFQIIIASRYLLRQTSQSWLLTIPPKSSTLA